MRIELGMAGSRCYKKGEADLKTQLRRLLMRQASRNVGANIGVGRANPLDTIIIAFTRAAGRAGVYVVADLIAKTGQGTVANHGAGRADA